jgi:hypothetical protein
MKFIVHENPVLRAESNYIARIDLAPFGFPDLLEQVWLRQESDRSYYLCCIPFRAYGLALRDKVRLTRDGAQVSELVERSGHRALRVLLMPDQSRMHRSADRIEAQARALGLLYEWSGDRHIAIDVPAGAEVGRLIDVVVEEEREAGALWEWADAEPFRVPGPA